MKEAISSDLYLEAYLFEYEDDVAGYAVINKKLFHGSRRADCLDRGHLCEAGIPFKIFRAGLFAFLETPLFQDGQAFPVGSGLWKTRKAIPPYIRKWAFRTALSANGKGSAMTTCF